MKVKIDPNKLDGVIEAEGIFAENLGASNTFGNRMRVIGKPLKINKYLLAFSAKGTKIDLTGVSELLPAVLSCALFAVSKTEISGAWDYAYAEETVSALNSLGGDVSFDGKVFKVNGKARVKGGEATVKDKDVMRSVLLLATCADTPCVLDIDDGLKEEFDNIYEKLKPFGLTVEIL